MAPFWHLRCIAKTVMSRQSLHQKMLGKAFYDTPGSEVKLVPFYDHQTMSQIILLLICRSYIFYFQVSISWNDTSTCQMWHVSMTCVKVGSCRNLYFKINLSLFPKKGKVYMNVKGGETFSQKCSYGLPPGDSKFNRTERRWTEFKCIK